MKFTCTVEIELPIEEVVEIFDSTENLKEWQVGFVSIEPISGNPGEPGSKSKMIYKMGSREMEILETIMVKNLPEEMTGLYEHKHMVNTMTNRFSRLELNKTKYEAEIEYTKMIGFIPKMMAFFCAWYVQKANAKMAQPI